MNIKKSIITSFFLLNHIIVFCQTIDDQCRVKFYYNKMNGIHFAIDKDSLECFKIYPNKNLKVTKFKVQILCGGCENMHTVKGAFFSDNMISILMDNQAREIFIQEIEYSDRKNKSYICHKSFKFYLY